MNDTANKVLARLIEQFPGQKQFRRKHIDEAGAALGFDSDQYVELLDSSLRVCKGRYDFTPLFVTKPAVEEASPAESQTSLSMSSSISSTLNEDTYIPEVDTSYVAWGDHQTILSIVHSKLFYPAFISGLSGNGKTIMVEQVCAKLGREYIRVQISPETDEDDLIGGFRLVNGETVFSYGPAVKAMKRGAVLLIDEIDRASSKIMCLQGIAEGKPILIKKTGEVVHPAPGFVMMATANTKGKGSDDGRFVTANILDEAFLERFPATIEQKYPPLDIELKIVLNHMTKYGKVDPDFAKKLVTWSEVIRKTYLEDAIDELISTRRLCHIAQSFAIFGDRLKAITICIARFDEDTKIAFADLYTKIDPSVVIPTPETPQESPTRSLTS